MAEKYFPELNKDVKNAKRKYIRCRGCDIAGRRQVWKDYMTQVQRANRMNVEPDSTLFLEHDDSNPRNPGAIQIRVSGRVNGTLGYLAREDLDAINRLLEQECMFRLDVADFNRIGEKEIPVVFSYVIPAKVEEEDLHLSDRLIDGVPEIINFACKVPYARVEEISPELAEKMLTHNSANRSLKMDQVASIANTIRNGHYVFTNQSIGFDQNGVLTDGQHRLHAIIRAGIPVPMVVVYGSNQSPYLDRGKKRTVSDNLKIVYGDDYNQKVVAMLNHVYHLFSGNHISMDEIKMHIAYDKVRNIIDSPKYAATFQSPKKLFGARYTAALFILILSEKFTDEDLEDMNSMFLYGVHAEGMAQRPQDQMIMEVRDMVYGGKKPFVRGSSLGADVSLDVDQTLTLMRAMLPYLQGLKLKKSKNDAKRFCDMVLEQFYNEVDAIYMTSSSQTPEN